MIIPLRARCCWNQRMKEEKKKVHSNLTYFNHATILQRTTYRSRTEKSKQEREGKKKSPNGILNLPTMPSAKRNQTKLLNTFSSPPLPFFRLLSLSTYKATVTTGTKQRYLHCAAFPSLA